jgi:hypothetical protein
MRNKKTKYLISATIISILLLFTIGTSQQVYAACPQGRLAHSMAYDAVNDIIIVYGGTTQTAYAYWTNETWSYDLDNNEWNKMAPGEAPYGKVWTELAYDSESGVIVCFGGSHAEDLSSDETSVYDYSTNTWTPQAPNNYPLLRNSHCMAYDSESDVVIMHGGNLVPDYNPYGDRITYNDTWAYDYNTNVWTNVTPVVSPLGMSSAEMVYDSESDRIIMFGGYHSPYDTAFSDPTGAVFKMETWAYDYNTNTWENASDILVNPDPRVGHAMAYDSESDLVVMFGGHTHLNNDGMQDETWTYNYNTMTWTLVDESTSLLRSDHEMVYDSDSDLIVIYGGFIHTAISDYLSEVWTFDTNTVTWTMIEQVCSTPSPTDFYILSLISAFAVIVIVKLKRR